MSISTAVTSDSSRTNIITEFKMKRLWIAVFGTLLFAQSIGFCQQIEWQTDLDSAKTMAAEQNKLVLIHFSADWCRPCKHMDTFVFTSSQVISAVQQRVVAVHIDTDQHPDLVKQYNVTEIPTDVVISTTGRVLQKRQSPKEASNFVRMLESLDSVNTALSDDRAALAQKIDDILVSGKSKELVNPESNDFVARKPQHEQPGPARESIQLQSNLDSRARLVNHVSEGEASMSATAETPDEPAGSNVNRKPSGPQRVINDQFFVEKTTAANSSSASIQPVNSTTVNAFVPSQSKATLQQEPAVEPAVDVVAGTLRPAFNMDKSNALQPIEAGLNPLGTDTAASHMSVNPHSIDASTANVMTSTDYSAGSSGESSGAVSAQVIATEISGLGGKCPVTLIQEGRWVSGDERFGCVHRGKIYLFADHDKMVLFQRDPESYSPILAGFDPVIFHEKGELTDGLEQHGVFMGKAPNQRIVLFVSDETRAQFQEDPRLYMSTIRLAIQQSDALK